MAGSLPVQSVARAAEILKRVGASADGLTLQQLSEQMGLKGPTLHHLARTLVEADLLAKTPSPVRYRIGQGFLHIAQAQSASGLLAIAERVMLNLAEKLPQATLTYSEPLQGQITTRLRIAAGNPTTIQRPSDLILSAYSSASALLFQALWPEATRLEFQRQHPFDEFGGNWPNLSALEEFLNQTRELKQSIRPGGPGRALAVASPVYLPNGRLIGCIGAAHQPPMPQSTSQPQPSLSPSLCDAVCTGVRLAAERITAGLADA